MCSISAEEAARFDGKRARLGELPMKKIPRIERGMIECGGALRVSAAVAAAIATGTLGLALMCLGSGRAEAQTAGQGAETRGAFEATSQLGRKLYAQPDDDTVAAARKKLAADPRSASLVIALSQAQAGRRQYREAIATCTKALRLYPADANLYIERGHRELGLREFVSAERDLARAASLDPSKLDAFYHLGLAHYFQGQFGSAAESFRRALALAKNNDSVIDCSNWLYVSLRRAKQSVAAAAVLKRITPEVKNKEPHLLFYLRLERFYQGVLTEQAVLPPKPADANDTEAELSFDTVTYGVGNWELYNTHDAKRATELFKQVIAGNAWNAWGFVGAETELKRMGAGQGARP
jgi:tetratricopeptide (TPR) repeat protein